MLNPTDEINLSFSDYVQERTMKEAKHLQGGIPDYAYAMDYTLRQKIRAMPGVFPLFKAITNTIVPQQIQELVSQSLRVTPRQNPRLHEIICHCAGTLGIGTPNLYIVQDPSINAGAYAVEDASPLIQITSGAVERLNDNELIAVLGHECGHIQNNHFIYEYAAKQVLDAGLSGASRRITGIPIELLSKPVEVALNAWSRAAEVTSDRAGLICCGSLETALSLKAKLLSGGILGQEDYDIEEILRQYDDLALGSQYLELMFASHPFAVRRMLAEKEFVNSQAYYDWHPEQKKPGMKLYTKEELDIRCDRYVSVLKNEKRRLGNV